MLGVYFRVKSYIDNSSEQNEMNVIACTGLHVVRVFLEVDSTVDYRHCT